MVPVAPLVASVDEVAGDQEEAGVGAPGAGGVEERAPLLEAALGVAHLEEGIIAADSGSRPRRPPRAPARLRPVAHRIAINGVRFEAVGLDDVPEDEGIVQEAFVSI